MKEESPKYLAKQFQAVAGISPESPDSARPVSGYLVNKSQIEKKKAEIKKLGGNIGPDAIYEVEDNDIFGDGLTAQGEIEVILRPEIAGRTSYVKGDPLMSGGRPVSMNSDNTDDILDAIIYGDGQDKKQRMSKAIIDILRGYTKDDFSKINETSVGLEEGEKASHEHFEALISGGFSKDDIEGIHYPYSKIVNSSKYVDVSDVVNESIIRTRAQSNGMSSMQVNMIYDDSYDEIMSSKPVLQLKEYREAQKVKNSYINAGIGYVKFAHPLGFNIENPKYYDPDAGDFERIEEVIKRNIFKEIDKVLDKKLSEMRKESRKKA